MSVIVFLALWIAAAYLVFDALTIYGAATSVMHQTYAAVEFIGAGIFAGIATIIMQLTYLSDCKNTLSRIENYAQHLERLDPKLKEKRDKLAAIGGVPEKPKKLLGIF